MPSKNLNKFKAFTLVTVQVSNGEEMTIQDNIQGGKTFMHSQCYCQGHQEGHSKCNCVYMLNTSMHQ
jgi:hypothetical protein